MCQSLFFNATLLKKRFWHRCFPVNFSKFSRAPFLQNTSRWPLLFLPITLPFFLQLHSIDLIILTHFWFVLINSKVLLIIISMKGSYFLFFNFRSWRLHCHMSSLWYVGKINFLLLLSKNFSRHFNFAVVLNNFLNFVASWFRSLAKIQ